MSQQLLYKIYLWINNEIIVINYQFPNTTKVILHCSILSVMLTLIPDHKQTLSCFSIDSIAKSLVMYLHYTYNSLILLVKLTLIHNYWESFFLHFSMYTLSGCIVIKSVGIGKYSLKHVCRSDFDAFH